MSSFCSSCGSQIADGAATCPACGKTPGQSAEERTAAAPAKGDAELVAGYRLARLGDRLLAIILDTLFLVAIFAVIGMWSAVRWGGVTASGFSIEGKAALITFSLVGVAAFLYYWILEAVAGATLGKAIVGIQVRMKGGGKCSFTAALLRNVLRIVDGIAVYLVGLLIAVFSKLRQRLGDHVAGTVVVERQISGFARAAFVILWLAGIAGGISWAYLLHRGAPVSATAAQTESTSAKLSRLSVAANQASVVASLRLLNTATVLYASTYDCGFPKTLAALGPSAANKPPDSNASGLIDEDLSSGHKYGYAFTYQVSEIDAKGCPQAYTIRADPASPGTTGQRHFFTDQTMVIRAETDRQAGKDSPSLGDSISVESSSGSSSSSTQVSSIPAVSNQTPVLTSGDFKLLNFAWTEGKDGPPRSPAPYKPGEDLNAKYDLTGFTTDPNGRVDVALSLTVFDPNGLALDKAWTTEVRQTLATPSTPIHGSFHLQLPDYAPGGTYKFVFKAHDALKNSDAEFSPTFSVEAGPPILPASKLEIRNFRYSTSKGGPPLNPAVYRPGQTHYSSYDVFGVQFRDDRVTFHTAYKLVGPDGQAVVDRPDWDTTDATLVYHPATFFVHFDAYVDLPSDAAKGTYTEQFVVTDRQANVTLNYEARFEVK